MRENPLNEDIELHVLATAIRGVMTDMIEDLLASGSPQHVSSPYLVLMRQVLEAGIARTGTDEAKEMQLRELLGAKWLDSPG